MTPLHDPTRPEMIRRVSGSFSSPEGQKEKNPLPKTSYIGSLCGHDARFKSATAGTHFTDGYTSTVVNRFQSKLFYMPV